MVDSWLSGILTEGRSVEVCFDYSLLYMAVDWIFDYGCFRFGCFGQSLLFAVILRCCRLRYGWFCFSAFLALLCGFKVGVYTS